MKKLLLLIVFAAIASNLSGASITVKWTGTTSDDWGTESNWDAARLPSYYKVTGGNTGDYVWVNYLSNRPEGCTISSGDHEIYSVFVMRDGLDDTSKQAILNLEGGSLNIKGYDFKMGVASTSSWYASHPTAPSAVVNIYNGFTLNVNGAGGVTIGDYYDATLNMYGGTLNLNAGGFRVTNNAYNGGLGYAYGTLNLLDGVININTWNATLGQADLRDLTPKSKINVGDGVMALTGDSTARLQAYANLGLIEAMPGLTLSITFNPNVGERGTTYLTAVPEPATVMLLSLGVVLLRKKK